MIEMREQETAVSSADLTQPHHLVALATTPRDAAASLQLLSH
jgi:hypothetical protein